MSKDQAEVSRCIEAPVFATLCIDMEQALLDLKTAWRSACHVAEIARAGAWPFFPLRWEDAAGKIAGLYVEITGSRIDDGPTIP